MDYSRGIRWAGRQIGSGQAPVEHITGPYRIDHGPWALYTAPLGPWRAHEDAVRTCETCGFTVIISDAYARQEGRDPNDPEAMVLDKGDVTKCCLVPVNLEVPITGQRAREYGQRLHDDIAQRFVDEMVKRGFAGR